MEPAITGLAAVMRDVTKRFEEMRALKQKLTGTTIAHDRDEAAPGDRA
jgi:hypothetical protein